MNRRTTLIVASLVIMLAGYSLWRTFRNSATRINSSLATSLGQVLADEVAKTIQDHGRVVAVIAPEHQQPGDPSNATWEAFRRELKKHSGILLADPETVPPDPNDPQPDMTGCPILAFGSILERQSQADAIVFFMGTPSWDWLQKRNLLPLPKTGKIIVLAGTIMGPKRHYEEYFHNGIMSELIIRGGGNTAPVARPQTAREWFDSEYRAYTPQTYELLPE